MPRTTKYTSRGVKESWSRDKGATFYLTNNYQHTATSSDVWKPSPVKVQRDAKGWRRPTSWAVSDDSYTSFAGNAEYWGSSPDELRRVMGSLVNVPSDYFRVSRGFGYVNKQRAETRALLKLKDQNVNYAVAAAEFQRSAGLVANTLIELVKAYSFAKKGRWRDVQRVLPVTVGHKFRAHSSAIADRWLELQYGWMPLLNDIYGAHVDVVRQAALVELRVSVKSTIRDEIPEYGVSSDTSGHVVSWSGKTRRMCKVVMHYETLSKTKALLARGGVSNPALIAWELVGFSFVVDWVAPIGEWLASMDADFGLKFLSGTCSQVAETKLKFKVSGGSKAFNANKVKMIYGTASSRMFRFDRSIYATTPWPLPYVKSPFSVQHGLNALALLRALVRYR